MSTARASRDPVRFALGLCLVAAALLLRMAVPAGWMPAEGRFGLQLCAGSLALPAAAPEHGGHHGGKHHEAPAKPDHPCAFAGLGAALLDADLLELATAALPDGSGVAILLPVASAVGRGLAAPPPPPTGPPARR